jgi:hypothetical protein
MASPAAEVFLTASLIASMVLIIGPVIRKQLLQSESRRINTLLLLAIDWSPFIFVFVSWGIDLLAFAQLNTDHERVLVALEDNSGISERIAASLSGWVSGTMALLLGFGLYLGFVLTRLPTQHELDFGGMSEEDNIRLANNIRRWGGWLWMLLLYGLLPDEPFPPSQGNVFLGEFTGSLSSTLPLWVALLLLGIVFGVAVMQLSLLMERADRFHPENPFPHQVGWLLLLPFIGLGFIILSSSPSGDDILALLLIDPIFGARTSFILGLSGLFLFAGTALHAHLLAERKFRVGRSRWLGLGSAVLHSVAIIWLTTTTLAFQLPNVGVWFGSLWLSTQLIFPLLIAGLIGMLLPIAGLDDRPRPELWGYRFVSAMAFPLLVAINPLSILLLPGILVGFSTAAIIPYIVEKGTRLEGKSRQQAIVSVVFVDVSLFAICVSPITGLGIGLALLVGAALSVIPMIIISKSQIIQA